MVRRIVRRLMGPTAAATVNPTTRPRIARPALASMWALLFEPSRVPEAGNHSALSARRGRWLVVDPAPASGARPTAGRPSWGRPAAGVARRASDRTSGRNDMGRRTLRSSAGGPRSRRRLRRRASGDRLRVPEDRAAEVRGRGPSQREVTALDERLELLPAGHERRGIAVRPGRLVDGPAAAVGVAGIARGELGHALLGGVGGVAELGEGIRAAPVGNVRPVAEHLVDLVVDVDGSEGLAGRGRRAGN